MRCTGTTVGRSLDLVARFLAFYVTHFGRANHRAPGPRSPCASRRRPAFGGTSVTVRFAPSARLRRDLGRRALRAVGPPSAGPQSPCASRRRPAFGGTSVTVRFAPSARLRRDLSHRALRAVGPPSAGPQSPSRWLSTVERTVLARDAEPG